MRIVYFTIILLALTNSKNNKKKTYFTFKQKKK